MRHANLERLTLVNGYPLAGPLGQKAAASGSIPRSFAGNEIALCAAGP
jgi:hypothetical protein